MKITIFGATGRVGQRVLMEALYRKHSVTAVERNPSKLTQLPDNVTKKVGDIKNVKDVISMCQDQDVVINTTRSATSDPEETRLMTETLMEGVAKTNARLIISGGAASLVVPGKDGKLVIDDPNYLPQSAKKVAKSSMEQYKVCLAEDRVKWTYVSPSANLFQGERTGKFELGSNQLIIDELGNSSISMEDLAMAIIDEVENQQFFQRRFTVGYKHSSDISSSSHVA